METVKKYARKVPYGTRVTVTLANGHRPTPEVIKRRREDESWDVQWFNFRENKWEREGERMTYVKAYRRAHNLGKSNPYAKIGVVLLPGRKPNAKLNGSSPKVDVDA
jgi:hypothetical protein